MCCWYPRRGAGAAAADQVLLGELLALRTILINLLFSVSKAEPVTPEQMQALIERADKDKDAAGAGEAGRVPADSSIGSRNDGGDGTVSEWGRKEYTGWPSRQPVWTWAAVFVCGCRSSPAAWSTATRSAGRLRSEHWKPRYEGFDAGVARSEAATSF